MKTKEFVSKDRMILTAMIVDKKVLARIAPRWEGEGLFSAVHSNLIGSWCVKHFRKRGEAPGRLIEFYFEDWKSKAKSEEAAARVASFLSYLSDNYKRLRKDTRSETILDVAEEVFTEVKIDRLAEEITKIRELGIDPKERILKIEERIRKFQKVGVSSYGNAEDLFGGKEELKEVFDEEDRPPVVEYHGDLGKFFGKAFEEESLVAFLAPEKRGKTWWLIDVAVRAFLQRKRVLFFEIGDMSRRQIKRRLVTRFAKRPIKADVTYKIPKSLHVEDEGTVRVEVEEKKTKTGLTIDETWKVFERIQKESVRSEESYFKLSVHPNNSISVLGIRDEVQAWMDREGWIPDLIVIDYADLIAPLNGKEETREQINTTWKELRAMSQVFHCAVVTATQADAASYNMATMTMSNFSEDKRKNAHVTGMVGINQNDAEKKDGIMRLNWIARREEEYIQNRCVYVASCLAIGNPAMRSKLP